MSPAPQPITAFDWQKRIWTSPLIPGATAEVIITSDWAPIRHFGPLMAADDKVVYGDLLPVLRHADLRITNLECPLTDIDQPVHKSGSVLRADPSHIKTLTAAPFEIVTLGNNHLFDHGAAAFGQTLDLLNSHRIRWLGAGRTPDQARQPLEVEVKGVRLALINFSEGEDLTARGDGPGVFGWEVERVSDQIALLKSRADVIVVICHCGVEYIPFPPPYVTEAFARLVQAGADLIIGHHPHVPQGVIVRHGVPICYSLGNFVFYQESNLYFRKTGYLVKAGLAKEGLAYLEVVPYAIEDKGLTLLTGAALEQFSRSLSDVSAPLADPDQITQAWHGFLSRYGQAGFVQEIEMLMDKLHQDPPKGAAMFRNRIATMQHNQHWIDALTRIIEGTIDDVPQWSLELNRRWMTQTC